MDICNIGGRDFSVVIISIKETFNKIYSENTGRTLSDKLRMHLDCRGTFYGHTVVVQRRQGYEADFDALFDLVSAPMNDGIAVKMVHNQSNIEYEAYISTGERDLKRVDLQNEKVYWDKMTLNLIPMEAYITL
jgi:hypothetical protein